MPQRFRREDAACPEASPRDETRASPSIAPIIAAIWLSGGSRSSNFDMRFVSPLRNASSAGLSNCILVSAIVRNSERQPLFTRVNRVSLGEHEQFDQKVRHPLS